MWNHSKIFDYWQVATLSFQICSRLGRARSIYRDKMTRNI